MVSQWCLYLCVHSAVVVLLPSQEFLWINDVFLPLAQTGEINTHSIYNKTVQRESLWFYPLLQTLHQLHSVFKMCEDHSCYLQTCWSRAGFAPGVIRTPLLAVMCLLMGPLKCTDGGKHCRQMVLGRSVWMRGAAASPGPHTQCSVLADWICCDVFMWPVWLHICCFIMRESKQDVHTMSRDKSL